MNNVELTRSLGLNKKKRYNKVILFFSIERHYTVPQNNTYETMLTLTDKEYNNIDKSKYVCCNGSVDYYILWDELVRLVGLDEATQIAKNNNFLWSKNLEKAGWPIYNQVN